MDGIVVAVCVASIRSINSKGEKDVEMKYKMKKAVRVVSPTAGVESVLEAGAVIEIQRDDNPRAQWSVMDVASGRQMKGFRREDEMKKWLQQYAEEIED